MTLYICTDADQRNGTACIYWPPVRVISAIFWTPATSQTAEDMYQTGQNFHISYNSTFIIHLRIKPPNLLISLTQIHIDRQKTGRLKNVHITNIIINVKIK